MAAVIMVSLFLHTSAQETRDVCEGLYEKPHYLFRTFDYRSNPARVYGDQALRVLDHLTRKAARMAQRTRAGMHYNSRRMQGDMTSPKKCRYAPGDNAYRAALGIEAGQPLPRALGSGRA